MIGFPRKSPCQQEWNALLKREERFLAKSRLEKNPVLNQQLERFVPEKLKSTLDLAFCKAFGLVFDKGTCVIEKTYNKEERENTYKINAYAASLKENRKTLKAFSRNAGRNKIINLAAASAGGIGLGILGIGLPDIPLFTGMLLKSIYETAMSYGFGYHTPEEQCYILMLISAALETGEMAALKNDELNRIGNHMDTWLQNPRDQRGQLIRKASAALSDELLYMKFLQGIPVVGMIGGMYDAVYMQKITDYADMKYKRRFLEYRIGGVDENRGGGRG